MANLPNHFEEDPSIVYVPNNTSSKNKKRKNEEAEAAEPLLVAKKASPAADKHTTAFVSYQSNINFDKPPATAQENATNKKPKHRKKARSPSSSENEEDEEKDFHEGPTTGRFLPKNTYQNSDDSKDTNADIENNERYSKDNSCCYNFKKIATKVNNHLNEEVDTPTCIILCICILILIAMDGYMLYKYYKIHQASDMLIIDVHNSPFMSDSNAVPLTYPMILLDEGKPIPFNINDLMKQGNVQIFQKSPPPPSPFELLKQDLESWVQSFKTKENYENPKQDASIIL